MTRRSVFLLDKVFHMTTVSHLIIMHFLWQHYLIYIHSQLYSFLSLAIQKHILNNDLCYLNCQFPFTFFSLDLSYLANTTKTKAFAYGTALRRKGKNSNVGKRKNWVARQRKTISNWIVTSTRTDKTGDILVITWNKIKLASLATHNDLQLCISNSQTYKSALSCGYYKEVIYFLESQLNVSLEMHCIEDHSKCRRKPWSIWVWHHTDWYYKWNPACKVDIRKLTLLYTISACLKVLPNS